VGLGHFSSDVVRDGTPLFEMERRLVPVYLLHRYQVEATAKLLGGLQYDYRLKGEPGGRLQPVDAYRQRQALSRLMQLLRPEELALPDPLRYLIPPPAHEQQRDREFFTGATGAPFDHLAPARAGADLVIEELLEPHRLARLVEQHSLDSSQPGALDVLEALLAASWYARPPTDHYLSAVRNEVDWRVLRGMLALAADTEAADSVRGTVTAALVRLADRLGKRPHRDDAGAEAARTEISRFLERPLVPSAPTRGPVPPGSPIG